MSSSVELENGKKTPPFLFTALTLENHCKIEMLLIHLAA
jgi:hypothetical protein